MEMRELKRRTEMGIYEAIEMWKVSTGVEIESEDMDDLVTTIMEHGIAPNLEEDQRIAMEALIDDEDYGMDELDFDFGPDANEDIQAMLTKLAEKYAEVICEVLFDFHQIEATTDNVWDIVKPAATPEEGLVVMLNERPIIRFAPIDVVEDVEHVDYKVDYKVL